MPLSVFKKLFSLLEFLCSGEAFSTLCSATSASHPDLSNPGLSFEEAMERTNTVSQFQDMLPGITEEDAKEFMRVRSDRSSLPCSCLAPHQDLSASWFECCDILCAPSP